jgi:hypothetical protein
VANPGVDRAITLYPRSDGSATAWPGGYLARRPACLPVVVTAGGRSARATLPLGRGS